MEENLDLRLGSCEEILAGLEADSIDSIVTDPPYGLKFMGKSWDYDLPSLLIWKEIFRVLKPGGHLISFGGTRTYHRMACRVEDAGFEIRDQLQWLFGQGFPKSMDIGKAIDKAAGAEREILGKKVFGNGTKARDTAQYGSNAFNASITRGATNFETAPATDAAKQWDGWGTALKPANEPILLARKPLSEKTVAANVLRWGTGGINVDGSRIGTGEDRASGGIRRIEHEKNPGTFQTGMNQSERPIGGRFPSNLLLDEEAARMLDEQSGVLKSGGGVKNPVGGALTWKKSSNHVDSGCYSPDSCGASRFFYVAKASTRERNAGLDTEPEKVNDGRNTPIDNPFQHGETLRKNTHPTVKPIKLMEYLVRLVTPPNGIVLDPFMGSGTTGIAAKNLGFHFLGIEKNPSYMEIARKRIG